VAGYITFPIVTDPDELSAMALDYLIANIPGWNPAEGSLEEWMILIIARMVAEARDVASRVPKAIFRYYGQTLLDIPPIDGANAETLTTWTAVDGAGYTVREGTVVAFRTAGDTLVPFVVAQDVVIPPGFNTTAPGEVRVVAYDEGEASNGIVAGPLEMVDALGWVTGVVSTVVTAGGADAESDDDYLDRLAEELTLMSPRLILPNDFAVYARRTPGVYRAVAIDGYNPGTATYGNARTITLAVVDVDGNAVPAGTKTAVTASLEAQREDNFLVFVIDPTYSVIDVNFTATAAFGYDPADVELRAEAAVTNFLRPYNFSGGDQIPPQWVSDTKIRYLEIATVLNNVEGLEHVTLLTIMGAAADYNLAGVAPLPQPGVITGAVT
jgi:uncharacterized phage protein gp47/JayE